MSLVIDASLAAQWFLPDERNEPANSVLRELASRSGCTPSHFWAEMRNVLLVAERRGRLGPGEATALLRALRDLPIDDAGSGPDGPVLELARRHGLSATDAAYLAVALDLRASLGTSDRRLAAAARAEGVLVLGAMA